MLCYCDGIRLIIIKTLKELLQKVTKNSNRKYRLFLELCSYQNVPPGNETVYGSLWKSVPFLSFRNPSGKYPQFPGNCLPDDSYVDEGCHP
ncbi:hypothetical protein TNCV_4650561 [Trichonephila clavipes]|nr:hypothetical protein TNCV_4650561 [Trichonephila clavipes]